MSRSLLDFAAGGAFMTKTLSKAKAILEKFVTKSQPTAH
jgi:hypothetical protein